MTKKSLADYFRVIAMHLRNAAMTVENLFEHKVAPILTSKFNYECDLRPDLKKALESKVSTSTMNKLELTIIDRSAIILVVNCPTKASVIDYLQRLSSYFLKKLATGDFNLVIDRYCDLVVEIPYIRPTN